MIETAREIRQLDKTVRIIFISSERNYAVESYSVKADNYLLKPVNASALYTCIQEIYTELQSLYSYEEQLTLQDGFYKCHRSYLVNIHHIDTYTVKFIQLRSGHQIPISRGCQKQFENAYFDFLFGLVAVWRLFLCSICWIEAYQEGSLDFCGIIVCMWRITNNILFIWKRRHSPKNLSTYCTYAIISIAFSIL